MTNVTLRAGVWLSLALCLAALPPARAQINQPAALNYTLPQIRPDRQALTLDLARWQPGKNRVLFFFSEQCGVTYFYRSRLQQLQKEFSGKGVAFLGVRCGKPEISSSATLPAEVNYLSMPFVDDNVGDLTRCFRVQQSLTFAVIDRTGRLRYRGGFDDSVDETKVRKPYLRAALRDILAGRAVAIPEGRAIGCAIIPIALLAQTVPNQP